MALLTDPSGPVWLQVQDKKWHQQLAAIKQVAYLYKDGMPTAGAAEAAEAAEAVEAVEAVEAAEAAEGKRSRISDWTIQSAFCNLESAI